MFGEQIIDYSLKLGAVFGMGAAPWFEIWTAVPLGVLLGLSLPVATAAAVAGNVVSVAAMVAVLPRLRDRIARNCLSSREGERGEMPKRQKRFRHLWDRYGIPGTTFGAPLLVGTHLATALCIILGAPARRVLIWITVSIMVWGVVTGVLCYLGLEGFKCLTASTLLTSDNRYYVA